MKVIPDTNVLVSGIFFGGVPGQIIDAWTRDRVSFVLTPASSLHGAASQSVAGVPEFRASAMNVFTGSASELGPTEGRAHLVRHDRSGIVKRLHHCSATCNASRRSGRTREHAAWPSRARSPASDCRRTSASAYLHAAVVANRIG